MLRKLRKKSNTSRRSVSSKEPVVNPGNYVIKSYSQEGEDVVLRRFLNPENSGFYVDIGAHHPERFSNTLFFYTNGWCGINVDADPDLMTEFEKSRPNDTNVTAAIGKSTDSLTFYVFNERAINTFDKKLADERKKVKGWEIVEERKIPVISLENLLSKYLPKKQKIDFISIDVEGHDFEVLKSNNWKKFRPKFLMIEAYSINELVNISKDPIVRYLSKQRYTPVAKTYYTLIFANQDTYAK